MRKEISYLVLAGIISGGLGDVNDSGKKPESFVAKYYGGDLNENGVIDRGDYIGVGNEFSSNEPICFVTEIEGDCNVRVRVVNSEGDIVKDKSLNLKGVDERRLVGAVFPVVYEVDSERVGKIRIGEREYSELSRVSIYSDGVMLNFENGRILCGREVYSPLISELEKRDLIEERRDSLPAGKYLGKVYVDDVERISEPITVD